MARLIEVCTSCGSEAETAVGQRVSPDGALWWWRGFRCTACGCQREEDALGEPPVAYRDAMLADEGLWGLEVAGASSGAMLALALKEGLGVLLSEALVMARCAPGVVWTGTRCEVERLRGYLDRRGVIASAACTSVLPPGRGGSRTEGR